MRQGQQNRRGRGRNNNGNNQNRKGQNPLTRSFESTGPDVKIRGTPAHIAEKYMALARDAQSSGDPVLAENYLQHAEHYNRIIMAFREQQMAQGGGDIQNGMRAPRPAGFGDGDEFGDDEGEFGSDFQPQFNQPAPRAEGGQQRHFEGQQQRYEDRGRGGHEGGNRPFQGRDRHTNDRGDRGGYPERHDRGERGERYQRNDRPERIERVDRPDRAPQPDIGVESGAPRRAERAAVPRHEQPEFLRRPVRRPRREEANGDEGSPSPAVEGSGD